MKLESIESVEISEIGTCENCGKETKYYDNSLDKYICSFECGQDLAEKLYNFLDTQG